LLIETYFSLKDTSKRFHVFKDELRKFLDLLYENDLEYLNQFYGVQIQLHDQTRYIIESLIFIYQAQDYKLDDELIKLLKGLYELNPTLRIQYRRIEPIYSSIIPKHDPNARALSELTSNEIDYNECKILILSLFTLQFTLPMFTSGKYISIVDQDTRVNSEAFEVYSLLEPYILAYDLDGLLNAYRHVMNKELPNRQYSVGLFKRSSFTTTWLEHAKNHTLPSLGVRWYNPKLLLHAMLRFPSNSVPITRAINSFLDELIRTYCQNRNKLEQQVRINILFSTFLSHYGDLKECKALLLLLDIYDVTDYSSAFISNCDYYIGSRFHQIEAEDSVHESYSFSCSKKIDTFKELFNKFNYADIVRVRTLIDIYENELESKRGSASFQKLHEYIKFLSDPFLSCAELIQAGSWRDIDSIGAPT
jgi:hypothetical protein